MKRFKPHWTALLIALGSLSSLAVAAQEPGTTDMSGMLFINASQQELASGDSNFNADLKRAFINVSHQLNSDWSLHMTTDVQWHRHQDPDDPMLRHFYAQRTINDWMRVRVGNAPTPWIQPLAQLNGYRYIDPGLTPRTGHGSPADWGVHLDGELADFGYSVSAITGAGFRKPRLGDSVDFEGRVYWQPVQGLRLHVGGYHGTRTQDKGDRPKFHTAQRWNTALTYNQGPWRAGVQYLYADNWRQVNRPEEDAANGFSVWSSYQINANYAVSLRHDQMSPNRRLDSSREQHYAQAALEWRYSPRLRFSAVVKHIDNTSNTGRQIDNEFGLWTLIVL